MVKPINVGIIGATGYVGAELFRLLLGHPGVGHIFTSSMSFEGQDMADVYANLYSLKALGPHLTEKYDGTLLATEDIVAKSDVVFTALPHGIAEKYADQCVKAGKKLVDLSADFRFGDDEATFTQWYKKSWDFPELHKSAVYGLPEMYREKSAPPQSSVTPAVTSLRRLWP